jgi:hypothetical protein
MEYPVAKFPFTYNGKPVVSKADDSDLGEILSSVLNIFRHATGLKFSFIADELAEGLNLNMFEFFKNNLRLVQASSLHFILRTSQCFPSSQMQVA